MTKELEDLISSAVHTAIVGMSEDQPLDLVMSGWTEPPISDEIREE